MTRTIYLDHSASTPTDPRVIETMRPYFTEIYGNTSSSHSFGRKAESALEHSREIVARILNCKRNEIIFTSGGSESDNLAIRGTAWAKHLAGQGNHLITTSAEHYAVRKTIEQLSAMMGFTHSLAAIDRFGLCHPQAFINACQKYTTLTSIMLANNEIGTINLIDELTYKAHQQDILFHTDAVQAAGQLSLDVQALGIDMMSLSAHKFYGPKGIGILFIREGTQVLSNMTGGSHEDDRRAGTHNTPLIVGLAKALELAYEELELHTNHYRTMRDQLIDGVLSAIPDAQLTGHPEHRLPSHASFIFPGIDTNLLLMHLDVNGIAGSGGAACKTGSPEPSEVLLAMGYSEHEAISGLRLTVGRQTTAEDIDYTVDTLVKTIEKLRKLEIA